MTECPELTRTDGEYCKSCESIEIDGTRVPYWDNEQRTCTSCPESAPNWDSSSKTCVANCPLETPVWTEIPYGDRACVSCEMKYGTAWSFWDKNANECVRACPDDMPVADISKVCMSCKEANASAPFWNPGTRECVKTCPEFSEDNVCKTCAEKDLKTPYWNGESCQSCSEATKYWDPIKKACVSKCDISVTDENSKLCSSC